jgi:hypothetical protein
MNSLQYKDCGLDEHEQEVMNSLVEAWNRYTSLDNLNSDDTKDFQCCVHQLQRILAVRSMRKNYPYYWR